MTTRKAHGKPAVPKDSASLVLYRSRNNGIEVLMGKRAKGHRFLPDVYVFPGGRLDASDFSHPVKRPLQAHVKQRLSHPGDMATALACAAVRETWEETGLVLGDMHSDTLVADLAGIDYFARAITPAQSPIRFNSRFMLADAEHAKGDLAGSGELVDLGWYSLHDALNMPVVDITEFVLEKMIRSTENGSLNISHFSLFTYIKGKSVVRQETL
ncbi:NUDIX hydrolase [Sneathiella sp.]|jgi:8-oxo-dGTP pyrophosphatase MutT (NUDIX family)|uniref:NUDIX hydrolase n=1 Tax=Sneathiella sp. TaxID=1964365 RepID=UPI0039E223A3